ncbi:MAG: UTP--glucose-1-phosphate uridylyltransferase [Deltaproteobacteria bacterium]|nr:UTP--glucose-1-phosphate uridylyltransferase [Deltaproteobacteria bacterium]
MLDMTHVDTDTWAVLNAHGFGDIPFPDLARRLAEGGFDPERNRVQGPVELLPAGDVSLLPLRGRSEHDRLAAIGARAISNGEVGVVVLNGGMATRFGGVAKGAAQAVDGRSFLDLKLNQVARASNGRAPVLLMNSFATDDATREHLATLDLGVSVRSFSQMVSLRLTPDGELFLGADGRPSPHATGHGDLPFSLVRSGELARFIERKGRWLTVSNVDNLAAGLDPAVVGLHIDSGKAMTVEVVRRDPGDAGGYPALLDGRATILEAFRLPRGFDESLFTSFNTNTFVFDATALAVPRELTWFAVQKNVDGRPAIQFERLVGQLADHVPTEFVLVPRDGAESRFVPIKLPSDLTTLAAPLRAVLGAQGGLGRSA